MSDLVFNIAKGRIVELYNRVKSNDPANAALVIIPVDAGSATDAAVRDLDTFALVTSGGVTERSTGGWGRKILTDTELAAWAPDDTNDRVDLDIPDLTWAAVTAGAVTDLIVCYDNDTTAGTDANLIPLTLHDFTITPDGSDVQAIINTAGFYRAN
jgi:hypothetical protein